MKCLIFTLAMMTAACAFAGVPGSTVPKGFTDDYDAALKTAAATGKNVLLVFSGSDWCIWCQRLDQEVFEKPEFIKDATNHFVCVMIDSPSDTSVLSEKAKTQNPALVERFQVRGFPSVFVLNHKGEKLVKTGYQFGGPEKYLKTLIKQVKDAPLTIKEFEGRAPK